MTKRQREAALRKALGNNHPTDEEAVQFAILRDGAHYVSCTLQEAHAQRRTEAALREALQAALDAGATVLSHHEHAQNCWGGRVPGDGCNSCDCGLDALRAVAAQAAALGVLPRSP